MTLCVTCWLTSQPRGYIDYFLNVNHHVTSTESVHEENAMKSYKWIVEVKEKLNLPSDYRAAELIGITRQSVSKHKRNEAKTLKDEQCIKVADLLGISPEIVIADQHLEAAKTPEEKAVWQNFLKLSGSAAASILGIATALPHLLKIAGVYILC
jgi:plasmid maintenance system antidote protein VapI